MNALPLIPSQPIADLHCDLLSYLSRDSSHSAYDLSVRCAIPQLKEGNIKVQTMAIFTETLSGSAKKGKSQAAVFKTLPKHYAAIFEIIRQPEQFELLRLSSKIGILPAIENASSFCEEDEELEQALADFTALQHHIGKIAYICLTWNTENRFGGGALTKVGLKTDGKRLIDYMHQRNIPLDLSHASDYLAYDVLNYLNKHGLKLPILASHSNLRAIANVPRNLPNELVKEIFARGGIIGINFVRRFIGYDSPENLVKHLECLLQMGGEKHVCFGADFFHLDDLPPDYRKTAEETFFPAYDHAGAYSKVLDLWRKNLRTPEDTLTHICYNNFVHFFKVNIFSEGII